MYVEFDAHSKFFEFRRGLLALYLANLVNFFVNHFLSYSFTCVFLFKATETGFNMMVDRNWIKSINNGQVSLKFKLKAVSWKNLFHKGALICNYIFSVCLFISNKITRWKFI